MMWLWQLGKRLVGKDILASAWKDLITYYGMEGIDMKALRLLDWGYWDVAGQ